MATDWEAAISQVRNLIFESPTRWIEESAAERGKSLVWVEAHSGVPGGRVADMGAKNEVVGGRRLNLPGVATEVGIRQYFEGSWKAAQVIEWSAKRSGGTPTPIQIRAPSCDGCA